MKVKFIKPYRGPLGTFLGGGTIYDLHPHIVGQIPEGYCKAVDPGAPGPADKQVRPEKGKPVVETKDS